MKPILTLNRFLLMASAFALASAVLAFIALGRDDWTRGSNPGDSSFVGLRKICLDGAVVSAPDASVKLPSLCAEWNQENAFLLLTFLGDTMSQADYHYHLFLTAKGCEVAGASLAVFTAVGCFLGALFLGSNWQLLPLFFVALATLTLQLLAPLFWALLQNLALTKLEQFYPTQLSTGWNFALSAVILALVAAVFVALARWGRNTQKDRHRRDEGGQRVKNDRSKEVELRDRQQQQHQQHQGQIRAEGTGVLGSVIEDGESDADPVVPP